MTARPRDAMATRTALLDAARELFGTSGYDATTVRAIADRAGVNQALLFRYFGNKEGLFTEAVLGQALELITDAPRSDLLERTVDAILTDSGKGAATIMAVLRSAGSTQVASDVRAQLGGSYLGAFTDLAGTDDTADAAARAELVLAWLLGITLLRSLLLDGPLADPKVVREHMLRTARSLLTDA